MVFDPDALRDVATKLQSWRPDDAVSIVVTERAPWPDAGEIDTPFDMDAIASASSWQLRHLQVVAMSGEHKTVLVSFTERQPAIIVMNTDLKLSAKLIDLMDELGRPQLDLRHLMRTVLAPALVALVAGSWITYLATSAPPVSLVIVGTFLVILALLYGAERIDRWSHRIPARGHRVRALSRKDTRERRADRNAAQWQAAWQIPAGALVGAAVTWLFTR